MRAGIHHSARVLAVAALLGAQPASVRAETLTLDACLRETVAHNPQIIAQRLALEQAAGQRLIFRSRALPTFQISGIAGQQGAEGSRTIRTATRDAAVNETVTETVSERPARLIAIGSGALYQPIFDAAIPASWRRGGVELAVARSNFLVIASAQLHAARLQFYQALFQQENGALLQGIAGGLAANAQGESQLLTAGLAGRQALLAARVQQANFQPGIFASAGNLATSRVALLQLMGRSQGAGADSAEAVTLDGAWEDENLPFDAADVAKEARARRPDLQALRQLIRAYTENANIARGGYYPLVRIYVTGDVLPQNFVRSDRPNAVRSDDQTRQTEIRPGVREDWNVIDTGAVRGSVRQLESTRDALAISLRELELQIPGELSLVRAELDTAARTRDLLEANTGLSEETLRMIAAGAAQGTNSQLEFLNAQTGVLSTRAGLLAARWQLSAAHAEYDRLTGGYLRFTPSETPTPTSAPAVSK